MIVKHTSRAFAVFLLSSGISLAAFAHNHYNADVYERASDEFDKCHRATISAGETGYTSEAVASALAACQAARTEIEREYSRLPDISDQEQSFLEHFRVTIEFAEFANIWYENGQGPNRSACSALEDTFATIDRAEMTDSDLRAGVQDIRTILETDFRPKCRSAGY